MLPTGPARRPSSASSGRMPGQRWRCSCCRAARGWQGSPGPGGAGGRRLPGRTATQDGPASGAAGRRGSEHVRAEQRERGPRARGRPAWSDKVTPPGWLSTTTAELSVGSSRNNRSRSRCACSNGERAGKNTLSPWTPTRVSAGANSNSSTAAKDQATATHAEAGLDIEGGLVRRRTGAKGRHNHTGDRSPVRACDQPERWRTEVSSLGRRRGGLADRRAPESGRRADRNVRTINSHIFSTSVAPLRNRCHSPTTITTPKSAVATTEASASTRMLPLARIIHETEGELAL